MNIEYRANYGQLRVKISLSYTVYEVFFLPRPQNRARNWLENVYMTFELGSYLSPI